MSFLEKVKNSSGDIYLYKVGTLLGDMWCLIRLTNLNFQKLKMLKKDEVFNLNQYGIILHKEFGEPPSSDVIDKIIKELK